MKHPPYRRIRLAATTLAPIARTCESSGVPRLLARQAEGRDGYALLISSRARGLQLFPQLF